MSAWIVSKPHIDVLVQALIVERVIELEQADEIGRMLWRENLNSVAYRYPNDGSGERPGPIEFRDDDVDNYVFEGVEAPLADAVVLQAIGCFDYQSCEHPGWESSRAKALAGSGGTLEARLAARLGLPWIDDDRYPYWDTRPFVGRWESETGRRVPWGVDDIVDAIA